MENKGDDVPPTFEDLPKDVYREIANKNLSLLDLQRFSSTNKEIRESLREGGIFPFGSRQPLDVGRLRNPLKWRPPMVFLKYERALQMIAIASEISTERLRRVFPPVDDREWELILDRGMRYTKELLTSAEFPQGSPYHSVSWQTRSSDGTVKHSARLLAVHKPDWKLLMRDLKTDYTEPDFTHRKASLTVTIDYNKHMAEDVKMTFDYKLTNPSDWNGLTMEGKPMKSILQVYLLTLVASYYSRRFHTKLRDISRTNIIDIFRTQPMNTDHETLAYDLILLNLEEISERMASSLNYSNATLMTMKQDLQMTFLSSQFKLQSIFHIGQSELRDLVTKSQAPELLQGYNSYSWSNTGGPKGLFPTQGYYAV